METGVFMIITHCVSLSKEFVVNYKAFLLIIILAAILYLSKPLFKKEDISNLVNCYFYYSWYRWIHAIEKKKQKTGKLKYKAIKAQLILNNTV